MPLLKKNAINRLQLASDAILDEAFHDLCKRFRNRGDHHDIWHLRFHWPRQKEKIKDRLLAGNYRLSPVKIVRAHEQDIQVWSAEDALVLNALRILMSQYFNVLTLKNNSKAKNKNYSRHAVSAKKIKKFMLNAATKYSFYMQIKLHDFYTSINHKVLMTGLRLVIQDTGLLILIQQYLNHLQDDSGEFKSCQQGIYKGSSLASLLAALYLQPLDELFEIQAQNDSAMYFRWRDTWVYFCHEQHHFNEIFKNMNTLLDQLDLKIDRHKSQLGPCEVENREVSALKYLMNEPASKKIALEIKEQVLKEQAAKELSIKEQAHVAG
jgi:RNA-directed DNA polymerase